MFLACGTMAGQTTTTQTVTADWRTVGQDVTHIRFNGDNVLLTFADKSEMEADMESVNISFTYSLPTAIGDAGEMSGRECTTEGTVYDLQGRMVREVQPEAQSSIFNNVQLKKGVYVVNGRKMVIK